MTVYLIRHPRPEGTAGLCYGQQDVAVSVEECQRVWSELNEQLPTRDDVLLVSSPLQRCWQLAERVAAERAWTLTQEPALREIHFGDWENRLWDELPRAELDAWAENLLHYTPPGGESVAQLQTRVLNWWQRLPKDRPVVAVTHAGVIRVVSGWEHNLPLAEWSQLAVPYGCLTILNGKGRIHAHE